MLSYFLPFLSVKIVEKMLPTFFLSLKKVKIVVSGAGLGGPAVRRKAGRPRRVGSTMAGDLLGPTMAGDLFFFFSRFGFQVTLGKWTIPSCYSCKKGRIVVL